MRMMLCIGTVLVAAFAGMASATAASVSAPVVPKVVKAGVRYPVSIEINLPAGSSISQLNYYWSGEGPFTFSYRREGNVLRSMLFTGNPGTYRLQAEICYRLGGKRPCVRSKATRLRVQRKK